MAEQTFRIQVVVDPSRVPLGTRPISRQLTKIEAQAARVRKSLGLTFAALAGGAIIFGAIRNMAKFEESIAVVRAVTKATAGEFEVLRDRAQELGITTRFSATQAADAMVLLARAGFSVAETMEAVGQTLLLAQAGGLAMAEAADITASTLRGFGLQARETARVTDVLTETANSANTNVSQLGQALKFVAPIAKGLGQTLEITNAALGALSDAGLKGTLAGTGLRRVLAELASPGRELTDILNAAEIQLSKVDPTVVSLTDALETLKLAGFDTGDALEVFGQRGGPAFAVLVDNIPKIRKLNKALKDSGGEAKRVAEIMDQTLSGALFRAKSALEGFNLAVGEVFASPVAIAFLDTLTDLFRLVARNADLLQVALVALALGGLGKLIAAFNVLLVTAIPKAVASLVALRAQVFATQTSFVALRASIGGAMAVGPFLAVGAAMIPLVRAVQQYNANMKELGEILNRTEEDSKFVNKEFTAQLTLMRDIARQSRINAVGQGKDGKATDAQIARLAELEKRLEAQKNVTQEVTAAQREANDRERRGADITEAAIARLERRRDALAALTQEDKIRIKFDEQIQRIEAEEALPTPKEKERIRLLIEGNTKLAVRQRIFERITGPQKKFNEELTALKSLLDDTVISQEAFNIELQAMQDALVPTALEGQLNSLEILEKELTALELRAKIGDTVADKMELENKLREEGEKITKNVENRINRVINGKRRLNTETRKEIELERELARQHQKEERQLDRLERRIKSQQALNDQVNLLRTLFDQGRLSAAELAKELENVKLKGLEASNELGEGFTRAFIKMKQEAEDLASVGEKVANVFADSITDALAQLNEKGKLSFKDLAKSIIADLGRILARLLVVQAISAVFGPSGRAFGQGPFPFPGKQEGGPVQANRSFIVGENGPELFVPDRAGTIVPNAKDAPQAPAPNIQIVNVQSEDDVPNAINDGGADEAIINALARNKDRVQQVIQ